MSYNKFQSVLESLGFEWENYGSPYFTYGSPFTTDKGIETCQFVVTIDHISSQQCLLSVCSEDSEPTEFRLTFEECITVVKILR